MPFRRRRIKPKLNLQKYIDYISKTVSQFNPNLAQSILEEGDQNCEKEGSGSFSRGDTCNREIGSL